jgi:hypothetical protein
MIIKKRIILMGTTEWRMITKTITKNKITKKPQILNKLSK